MTHFFYHFRQCNGKIGETKSSNHFATIFGADLFIFFIHRIPLTWKPPFGYLMMWFVESASLFCVFLPALPLMCLSIGFSWLILAVLNEITIHLSDLKINRVATLKRRKRELKMHLYKIIHLHSHLKQLWLKWFSL